MRILNRKAVISAQELFRLNPGSWTWKLSMWKIKQAYGIDEIEPLPEIGDTVGLNICVYSNAETRSYIFVDSDYLYGIARA